MVMSAMWRLSAFRAHPTNVAASPGKLATMHRSRVIRFVVAVDRPWIAALVSRALVVLHNG